MTADVLVPGPTVTAPKRWRVELADKTTRTIEARGFRVEHGALVLVQPLECGSLGGSMLQMPGTNALADVMPQATTISSPAIALNPGIPTLFGWLSPDLVSRLADYLPSRRDVADTLGAPVDGFVPTSQARRPECSYHYAQCLDAHLPARRQRAL